MSGLSPSDHVVVVGAGLAGWRTCEELRAAGFAGALTLIGDEPYPPYDRPPLSKQVMSGKWTIEHVTLASPEKVASLRVDLILGAPATRLDVESTSVTLGEGRVVMGTHVVIATGARARRLPLHREYLFEVRGRDDVARLIDRLTVLAPGDVVAVIGGGFIGAEVATAVLARGLRPVVLEAASRPLVGVLGEEVSRWLEGIPSDGGVEVRTLQRIVAVEAVGDAGDADVLFEDGTRLRARAVVVGVGAQPNVEWLSGSGLTIDDGVVVDEHQLCHPRVAAVGDVANFAWGDEHVRIEHWQVATDHAAALARYWMTGEDAAPLVPYFWSDQYGRKIQVLGHPRRDDEVRRVKDTGAGQWLGLYSRDGVVSGLVALNQPRALMLSRSLLVGPTRLEDALSAAPWDATSSSPPG
jgi:3-phenylpropionate/trans-cinnamate dioxygenase ferredoxin reductase subunit